MYKYYNMNYKIWIKLTDEGYQHLCNQKDIPDKIKELAQKAQIADGYFPMIMHEFIDCFRGYSRTLNDFVLYGFYIESDGEDYSSTHSILVE